MLRKTIIFFFLSQLCYEVKTYINQFESTDINEKYTISDTPYDFSEKYNHSDNISDIELQNSQKKSKFLRKYYPKNENYKNLKNRSLAISGDSILLNGLRLFRDGEQFRQNAYETNRQRSVKFMKLSTDMFVSAWRSYYQDGDKYGVYLRIYTKDAGTKWNFSNIQNNVEGSVTSEFKINTYTQNSQWATELIKINDSLDFIVFWDSYSQDGDQWGVYAQIMDKNGNKLGPETLINETTAGNQEFPTACKQQNGYIAVFWYEFVTNEGNKHDIFGRMLEVVEEGGVKTIKKHSDEFRMNQDNTGRQEDPSVISQENNKFVISYESCDQDFQNKKVVIQLWRHTNQLPERLGDEMIIFSSTGTGWHVNPELVRLAPDRFAVVWVNMVNGKSKITARIFQASDVTAESPAVYIKAVTEKDIEVSDYSTDSNDDHPEVDIINENGYFCIVYTYNEEQVHGGIFDKNGEKLGQNFVVSDWNDSWTHYFSDRPAIQTLSEFEFLVGYTNKELYAQKYKWDPAPYAINFSFVDGYDQYTSLQKNLPIGTFTTSDPNSEDSHTYQILSDANNAAYDNSFFKLENNKLLANISYSAKQDYTIYVKSTDSSGLEFQKKISINLPKIVDLSKDPNANATPTDINYTTSSDNIIKDNNKLLVGDQAAVDATSCDTFSYSIVGNNDAELFEINQDNKLYFKLDPGALQKDNYSVTVKVTDKAGNTFNKDFAMTIPKKDSYLQQPEFTFQLDSMAANATEFQTGMYIGKFQNTNDTIKEMYTYTYDNSLSGNTNFVFNINNNILTYNGWVLNNTNVFNIKVRAQNSRSLTYSKELALSFTNLGTTSVSVDPNENATPTDINYAVSNDNIIKDNNKLLVGDQQAVDATSCDTFSYAIVGNNDADSFEINQDNKLYFKLDPGALQKDNYSVTVKVTDKAGNTFNKDFAMTIPKKEPYLQQPKFDFQLDSIAENATEFQTGMYIGKFQPTNDTLKEMYTYTWDYSLIGNSHFVFNINNNILTYNGNPYNDTKSFLIKVIAKNSKLLTYSKVFLLYFVNLGNKLHNALFNFEMDELAQYYWALEKDFTLGTFKASSNQVLNYSLVNDGQTNSTDNQYFKIKDSSLLSNIVGRPKNVFENIKVRSTDNSGTYHTKIIRLEFKNLEQNLLTGINFNYFGDSQTASSLDNFRLIGSFDMDGRDSVLNSQRILATSSGNSFNQTQIENYFNGITCNLANTDGDNSKFLLYDKYIVVSSATFDTNDYNLNITCSDKYNGLFNSKLTLSFPNLNIAAVPKTTCPICPLDNDKKIVYKNVCHNEEPPRENQDSSEKNQFPWVIFILAQILIILGLTVNIYYGCNYWKLLSRQQKEEELESNVAEVQIPIRVPERRRSFEYNSNKQDKEFFDHVLPVEEQNKLSVFIKSDDDMKKNSHFDLKNSQLEKSKFKSKQIDPESNKKNINQQMNFDVTQDKFYKKNEVSPKTFNRQRSELMKSKRSVHVDKADSDYEFSNDSSQDTPRTETKLPSINTHTIKLTPKEPVSLNATTEDKKDMQNKKRNQIETPIIGKTNYSYPNESLDRGMSADSFSNMVNRDNSTNLAIGSQKALLNKAHTTSKHIEDTNKLPPLKKPVFPKIGNKNNSKQIKTGLSILEKYLDPLTGDLIVEPVSLSTGNTYDMSTLLNYTKANGPYDPINRKPLSIDDLLLNEDQSVKKRIEDVLVDFESHILAKNEEDRVLIGKWIESRGRNRLLLDAGLRKILNNYDQSFKVVK